MQNSIFEKNNFEPADSIFFYGTVVKTTPEEIEKLKKYILSRPKIRLIYQHKDVAYLKILRAEPSEAKANE